MTVRNNITKKIMPPQKVGFRWIIISSIIFCQFFTYTWIRTESTQTIIEISSIRNQLAKKLTYQNALLIERARLKSDDRITRIAKTRLNLLTSTLSQTIYLAPERKPPIFPITALEKNFNPQNTQCIPPVKIFPSFVLGLVLEKIARFSFKHYLPASQRSDDQKNLSEVN